MFRPLIQVAFSPFVATNMFPLIQDRDPHVGTTSYPLLAFTRFYPLALLPIVVRILLPQPVLHLLPIREESALTFGGGKRSVTVGKIILFSDEGWSIS